MSISIKTHKMLWGRAANRCAFPDCRRELVWDASGTDDESLVGDEAHIIGRSNAGPRGDSDLPSGERDTYANLILLCKIHHKIVDDQRHQYSETMLKEMKKAHEEWVRTSLSGYDSAKQSDDELYAAYIDEWGRRSNLENWTNWTAGLFSSACQNIARSDYESLRDTEQWLFRRVWPNRYPKLEGAFTNFRLVAQDLRLVFDKHSIELNEDRFATQNFYKLEWHPQATYNYLSARHDYHVALVEDLTLELTRAANYICDMARQYIDPAFRLHEGVLVVDTGLHMDLCWHTVRPEYRAFERKEIPYPGLEGFKDARGLRAEFMETGHDAGAEKTGGTA